MLKLRLKRTGRKRLPVYRLVVIDIKTRRDGRVIDQVGYYNSITKELFFDSSKISNWLSVGVKPTSTVLDLLFKSHLFK